MSGPGASLTWTGKKASISIWAITTTANEDSKTSAHFAHTWTPCTGNDRINSAEWYEKVTNRQKYREEVALLQEHSGNSKSTRKGSLLEPIDTA